ncbi:MAG: glutaredoxin family protein [bacterium]
MQELKLFYFSTCPFCRKVLKFIKKNNVEDNIVLKNIHEDRKAKEELKEVGGKEQVPCLFIDGKPLYESNSIIEWLNENMVS